MLKDFGGNQRTLMIQGTPHKISILDLAKQQPEDPDIRLSWLMDLLATKGMNSLNYLLYGRPRFIGEPAYMELFSSLDFHFKASVHYGASTEKFRTVLKKVAREWAEDGFVEVTAHKRGLKHLEFLEQAADLLDQRDGRELTFVRQMEKFVALVLHDKGLPQEDICPFSYVNYHGGFSKASERLFRSVLNDREKYFREFEESRLNYYRQSFRELGLSVGLSEETMAVLDDELLIELAWFHTGVENYG